MSGEAREEGESEARSWNVLARDPEASDWSLISTYGFWLRHPGALDTERPGRPEGLESQADKFRRLGNELYVLEYDLVECINEFKTAYQVLYRPANDLALKKFAVVYHVDNFNARVQKFIENVYELLALVSGVDLQRNSAFKGRSKKERIRDSLEPIDLRTAAEAVAHLERETAIELAVDDRHTFVHGYRHEPSWPMLGPESRTREFDEADSLAAEMRRLIQPRDLDYYADGKADELVVAIGVLRLFRQKLRASFEDRVIQLLGTRSEETRQRFRWIREMRDLWNSLQ